MLDFRDCALRKRMRIREREKEEGRVYYGGKHSEVYKIREMMARLFIVYLFSRKRARWDLLVLTLGTRFVI